MPNDETMKLEPRKLWETPRVIVAEVADETNGGALAAPESFVPASFSQS